MQILNDQEFVHQMDTFGFCKFENVISRPEVAELRTAIDRTIDAEIEAGTTRGQYAYLAHVHDVSFKQLLITSPLQKYVDLALDPYCIVHSYNMIRIVPGTDNPIQNAIHRDSPRFCRPYKLAVQILYMIDDFTEENGATYLLPGSHLEGRRPTDEEFGRDSIRLTGNAGDAVIFDSMTWHAGGSNLTEHNRRGLTLVYTRHFMKQQIDLTRATPPEITADLDQRTRRLLGFDARVPENMAQFMTDPESRLYKPNQG